MRIKLTIAYDGTNFYGFEHQTNKRNIEDEILKAIQKIDPNVKKIYGSGRTDRFVHARGQVIHFDSDRNLAEYRWTLAINSNLPDDINILKSGFVDENFHARYSAREKEYRYLIRFKDYDIFMRNYMDYIRNLDLDLLESNLKLFQGTHDFKGFCSAQISPLKNTIKTITKVEMIYHDDYVELVFVGDGFLKHQVRKMCGTLVDIATGRKDESIISEIFDKKDPKLSNRVLSGHGLYLMRVEY